MRLQVKANWGQIRDGVITKSPVAPSRAAAVSAGAAMAFC